MTEMQKIIFKDGEQVKAVTGYITGEDDFFIHLKAVNTGAYFRIGKSFVIAVKPATGV